MTKSPHRQRRSSEVPPTLPADDDRKRRRMVRSHGGCPVTRCPVGPPLVRLVSTPRRKHKEKPWTSPLLRMPSWLMTSPWVWWCLRWPYKTIPGLRLRKAGGPTAGIFWKKTPCVVLGFASASARERLNTSKGFKGLGWGEPNGSVSTSWSLRVPTPRQIEDIPRGVWCCVTLKQGAASHLST